jgi:hypothetical protein
MSEFGGYILRIASKEWVNEVFNMAVYYTNMRKKWMKGQTVLFLHKISLGDALVGYGLVERAWEKEELSELDRNQCDRGNWKRAIEFTYVKQFDEPLAIKNTFLKSSKLRGRYFHGLRLNHSQIEALLAQAEA